MCPAVRGSGCPPDTSVPRPLTATAVDDWEWITTLIVNFPSSDSILVGCITAIALHPHQSCGRRVGIDVRAKELQND